LDPANKAAFVPDLQRVLEAGSACFDQGTVVIPRNEPPRQNQSVASVIKSQFVPAQKASPQISQRGRSIEQFARASVVLDQDIHRVQHRFPLFSAGHSAFLDSLFEMHSSLDSGSFIMFSDEGLGRAPIIQIFHIRFDQVSASALLV
jgi:hypothetical protein